MRASRALSSKIAIENSPRLLFSKQDADTIVEALRARLKSLEDEILRLAKLASETDDRKVQQGYLDLAQDLQRDAREVRKQLNKG
jgi:rubrerythrin